MNCLIEFGLSDKDLKMILSQGLDSCSISDDNVNNKINVLKYIDCTFEHIRNIIVNNPFFLEMLDGDVLELIRYFKKLGLRNINLLFNDNPYLLNKEVFEIRDYVNTKIKAGITLSDIVYEIENNPYIIDEIN